MYVKHTFLSKSNTIVRGEKENLSLNPIMELSYGPITTRGLIFFDINKLKELHDDKTYPDLYKLTHTLKMFNTGSIQHKGINKCFPDQKRIENRERAISFDLIFFKIPEAWDAGRGFDYTQDEYYGKHIGYSEYGSNWFYSKTETKWNTPSYIIEEEKVHGITYDSFPRFCTLLESPYFAPEDSTSPIKFKIVLPNYTELDRPSDETTYTEFNTFPEKIDCCTNDYFKIQVEDSEFKIVSEITSYNGKYVKCIVDNDEYSYYMWDDSIERYVILDNNTAFKYYERNYSLYSKTVYGPGIYSTDKLDYELSLGEESNIIIGTQHFDYGNENIELDITQYVNDCIENNTDNFGIGIAFAPCFEEMCPKTTQYVGFFTGHTNSFFEPYVESIYNDRIIDDRANFYLDKTNRLYFHSIIGGKHVNLDDIPTCTINNTTETVEQAGKGLYYVELEMVSDNYAPETMYYDEWSSLAYNSKNLPSVEKFFTTKSSEGYYNFGCDTTDSEYKKIIPNLYGIKNNEKLHRENIVKVNVEYVIKYTKKQEPAIYDSEYRLYIKQGEREITVIDWQPVHCDYIKSYFYIDTSSLIPGNYFIDIKCIDDIEETIHRNMLEFEIVNDNTEIKC